MLFQSRSLYGQCVYSGAAIGKESVRTLKFAVSEETNQLHIAF